MLWNIELNIKNITVDLAHKMIEIGESNGLEVWNHGWDRLVFESESGKNFTKLVNELDNVCKVYGVQYTDLLDLD